VLSCSSGLRSRVTRGLPYQNATASTFEVGRALNELCHCLMGLFMTTNTVNPLRDNLKVFKYVIQRSRHTVGQVNFHLQVLKDDTRHSQLVVLDLEEMDMGLEAGYLGSRSRGLFWTLVTASSRCRMQQFLWDRFICF
jgi:hydroxylamine reductase (hybrid-cluster protein)